MSREMDALVAEKVMGFHLMRYINYPDREPVINPAMFPPDYTDEQIRIPNYSTDIAAAWLVVEKMSELGWYFNIATTDPYDVTFSVDVRDERHGTWDEDGQEDGWITHDVRANTAPLAICRAALKAVEND